ncbi:MAG: hypothetical protein WAM07_15220, partial [Halobacillus sp.]|uniref:hypothetical protein n=1 Tax=Halobacillus sp. TaxID=56800 RepID=UPI003BAE9164
FHTSYLLLILLFIMKLNSALILFDSSKDFASFIITERKGGGAGRCILDKSSGSVFQDRAVYMKLNFKI